jgi:hypothetical protein
VTPCFAHYPCGGTGLANIRGDCIALDSYLATPISEPTAGCQSTTEAFVLGRRLFTANDLNRPVSHGDPRNFGTANSAVVQDDWATTSVVV